MPNKDNEEKREAPKREVVREERKEEAVEQVGTPVPDDKPRPVSLQFFAMTNGYRFDRNGDKVRAEELMGAFVYNMQKEGRLADTEVNYRSLFDQYCNS